MKQKIVNKVLTAGVVGAGGAGFPTNIKLNADVKRIIGNGASCEPLLMSDPYLMEHQTDLVLRGLHLAMQSCGADRGTICLKGKHSAALEVLAETVGRGAFADIDVFELADFYPAGDEQVLVHEVTGHVVPEGGIPLQVGAVVSNVETLINIARAVDDGVPVTERFLTVTGEVARPLIMKVPIGTSIEELITLAGGSTIGDFKVVLGGPMMGKIVSELSTPITKTSSGVVVLPTNHNVISGKTQDPERVKRIARTVCCQCTRCTDLCPRHLLGHSLEPHKIMRQLGAGISLDESIIDALICSECGICEKYACPMMISPREANAYIKQELLQRRIKRETVEKDYKPSNFLDVRKIPTPRLMERLKIKQYDCHPEFYAEDISVTQVVISLKQHLGAAALAIVKVGDRVKKGDLIGDVPEGALSAKVHASIDGVVTSLGEAVTIMSSEKS